MQDQRTAFAYQTLLTSVAVMALVAGCATPPPPPPPGPQPASPPPLAARPPDFSHLATFTTRLAGSNEAPPTPTAATGTADAVLDRKTRLLRWKMSWRNLSGPVTMAHFHGPAAIGANAGVSLGFAAPVTSPYEGRATLTPQQAADLLAGRWYINVHTAKFPAGEIRGQMIERK